MFNEATIQEIDAVMQQSAAAFAAYRKTTHEQRAQFLEAIAQEIEALGDSLLHTAAEETNLPLPRLTGERARTTGQLRMFAAMLRKGDWLQATIDRAITNRNPPKPDLRKMLVPIGAIVVFGASNFPFAYSTAGGDTASALAVGCTVVVKAHPAHAGTSQLVAGAIAKAIRQCNMPPHCFQHVHGASFETGKALVQHPATAGVGFTGSFSGGQALYNYAQQRPVPIPVFAEMGSINPVVLLPDAVNQNAETLAQQYAASITLGMGQFCTNPGLLIGIAGASLDHFLQLLGTAMAATAPAKMLHSGIGKAYAEKCAAATIQPGVTLITRAAPPGEQEAPPTLATVSGATFLQNPLLHEEVFGPYSLVVQCADMDEIKAVLQSVRGQLTTTLMGTDADLQTHRNLLEQLQDVAGRIIINGVPTGVEVCTSMVHGGPFPASTDARFTAVGTDAVKRWCRPVCYQNCPDWLLPAALQDANPLGILRVEY
jgi:NADP-dependent aldehyde dehydrogenase